MTDTAVLIDVIIIVDTLRIINKNHKPAQRQLSQDDKISIIAQQSITK